MKNYALKKAFGAANIKAEEMRCQRKKPRGTGRKGDLVGCNPPMK